MLTDNFFINHLKTTSDDKELQKHIDASARPEHSIDEYLQINSKVFQARLRGVTGQKYNEEVIDKGYDN